MTTVVVGNGMAGARFAAELRARDPHRELVVLGAEQGEPYNRILLSELLAGKVGPDDITLAEPSGPIDRRDGVTVTAVDPDARVVETSAGSRIRYETLVLATGSRPFVPPIAGLTRPGGTLVDGAVLFRNLEDCREILRLAEAGTRAVVLGGGLLGLEAARGLATRGLQVDVLHARRHLMERQLDPDAGRVLERTLRGLGVHVRVNAVTDEVRVDADGRLREVVLDDGSVLPADLLVVSCGTRPDTGLAEQAGLDIGHGVVVDDRMRTSDPSIYAIGDCAEHRGTVYGLVAPAWEQSRVAAAAVCGEPGTYSGSRLVTRLKAPGVDLASMGDPHIDAETDERAEVVTYADPARETYQKVVIRDRRLVGAILLGDSPAVGTVTQLFDRDAIVPGDPRSLLFGRGRGAGGDGGGDSGSSPSSLAADATVCRCNGVSAGAIARAWLRGARSPAEVAAATRASTGCGSCRSTIEGYVAHLGEETEVTSAARRAG